MRVQRKHDIVQAKLKKERQQAKGGTPGAADTVNEAAEVEDLSNTNGDTEKLADLPTDSEPEGTTGETSGEEQILEGGPQ